MNSQFPFTRGAACVIAGLAVTASLAFAQSLTIPVNKWTVVQPVYTGAPNGGQLYPQGWANKGVYDPLTKRILFSDRWIDPIRGVTIFANGIYAYDPATNVVSVLKLNNWRRQALSCSGCATTIPMPENETDPTPPDHHPLSTVETVPELNAIYTLNGINSYLLDTSVLNSSWKLDLGSRTWTKVSEAGDANYPPNYIGSPSGLVYDQGNKKLVHFVPSGCGCSGTRSYLFDPFTSTWSLPAQDPTSLNVYAAGAGVAYDSKRGLILSYGGNAYITNPGTKYLWAYSVATNKWTRLADAPVAAMAPAFSYDSVHDIFLALVGNNTYIYNPVLNSWSQYPATLVRPARLQYWQNVTYNPGHDVFVFQGGTYDAPLFALFRYDPAQAPGLVFDTTPPTVAITSPANGQQVTATIVIQGTATKTLVPGTTDLIGVAAVQFKVNGNNLGPIQEGNGPTSAASLNTATLPAGPHIVSMTAWDSVGNSATSSITIQVQSAGPPPILSGVTVPSVTPSGATITWTTDKPATTQVAYGLTSSYGAVSGHDTTPKTTHSMSLVGLRPSTTYHFQALSRDAQGNLGGSVNFTFVTEPPLPPLLHIRGEPSEVSGSGNGALVTPTIAPTGFSGTVMLHGTGSVNFVPASEGNGVYFRNCCGNTNRAYYKFTGATVGSIFNINSGEVTFYLKSRYTFSERLASGAARYVFDVRDNDASRHSFYFQTRASNGQLAFSYATGGPGQFYYAPAGTEETLFGKDVVLKVMLSWNGSSTQLYLNDQLVKTTAYTKPVTNWTASSVFAFGGYEYANYGGYNASDDVIDEFAVTGPPIVPDTTAPMVSLSAPLNSAIISGNVTVSATATDNMSLQSVQFQLNGANLGTAIIGAGPSFSYTWNTTGVANGPYTLSAIARDAAGNTATSSSVAVTVNNPSVPAVISSVAAASITASGATITWTTNKAASSQVAYGTTTAYGSQSPLSATLVTAHSVTLTGLSAAATYNYQVMSRDAQGNLTTSANFTFTTAAPPPVMETLLHLRADASEVSGTTSGAIVTPAVAPVGFTGTVMLHGTGSVNFAPAVVDNGVYFRTCCANTNRAYYKFTGTAVGSIFNMNVGQVTFYLKSRYSFTERQASAAARYAFDVRDNDAARHLFYFQTRASAGQLVFSYGTGGAGQFYYVPAGTEETVFGKDVVLKVTLSWNGSTASLYLNDQLVKAAAYSKAATSWTAASVFAFGGYEYGNFGGYNTSDDVIDEFVVTGPPIGPDTTAPIISLTAPSSSSTVSGNVTVSATASDNMSLQSVQFQLNGTNLGAPVTGAGPSFSYVWNTTGVANGSYILSAIARDGAGNTTTSNSVAVAVNNASVPAVISAVAVTSVTASGATITWTTNKAATSQVAYGTSVSYGSQSQVSTALVTSHSVTLTGLTAATTYQYQVLSRDAQGNLTASPNFTFATAAPPPVMQTLLHLRGEASEVSGTTNGAVVTPTEAPAGFTGTVMVHGTGFVNFAPAMADNGVYFGNCCGNTNRAYYKFTGAAVGNIFNMNMGQVTFYVKSRYSMAERQASASAARYAFDVRDNDVNRHLFFFQTRASAGQLIFSYATGGAGQFYYVPAGTEETLFGKNVVLKVTLSWNGSTASLYLNDQLVKSTSYTKAATNWTGTSVFAFGGYEYANFGGYNSSDDIIDDFKVSAPTP